MQPNTKKLWLGSVVIIALMLNEIQLIGKFACQGTLAMLLLIAMLACGSSPRMMRSLQPKAVICLRESLGWAFGLMFMVAVAMAWQGVPWQVLRLAILVIPVTCWAWCPVRLMAFPTSDDLDRAAAPGWWALAMLLNISLVYGVLRAAPWLYSAGQSGTSLFVELLSVLALFTAVGCWLASHIYTVTLRRHEQPPEVP